MTITIRRVLIPTDFSASARFAQDYAVALASQLGAELHALHVVTEPLPLPGPHGTWIRPEEALPGLIKDAERQLVQTMEGAGNGINIVCKVRAGNSVCEIMDYADATEIDLIVVGTHGRTGLSHLLIGSVAEKLVRASTCPVLTVHPRNHTYAMDAPTNK